jgi:hypothetical protein
MKTKSYLLLILFTTIISLFGLYRIKVNGLSDSMHCDLRTVATLIQRKLMSSEDSIEIIRNNLARAMDWVPSQPDAQISMSDPFQKMLYHRFANYQALSYFANEDEIRNMSGATVHGRSLWTGDYELRHRRSLDGIRTIFNRGNDAVYTLVQSHTQKLIVLSFRGSHIMADYWADISSRREAAPDSRFFNSSQCQYDGRSSPGEFFVGKGFQDTLPEKRVLMQVVKDLLDAKRANPGYSIVITGHSLGAAKAFLSTQFLSLYYLEDLHISALYLFGMPIIGSTTFADYMARCIGPQKIVRVVSSDDIVPWVGAGGKSKHSSLLKEVFSPNSYAGEWIICQGPEDTMCSARTGCSKKNWNNHSRYGGILVRKVFRGVADKKTKVARRVLQKRPRVAKPPTALI